MRLGLGLTIAGIGKGADALPPYDLMTALGSDLIAYWDANRADSFTLQELTVNKWRDLVAGYELLAADPPSSPIYSPDGFNGAPCVTFNGAQWLTSTDAGLMAALPSGSTDSETWVICEQTAAPADTTERYIVGWSGSSVTSGRAMSRIVTSGKNLVRSRTGTGAGASNADFAGIDFTGRHILRQQVTPTRTYLDFDWSGSPASVAVVPATTNTRIRFGSIPAAGQGNLWIGSLVAVLITKALSPEKALALHNRLG
jgi:hypothetical protein